MKKCVFIVLLLLSGSYAYNQTALFSAGPTWTTTRFTPGLLNDMLASYNAYANGFSQELQPFSSTMTGPSYALYMGFISDGMFIGLQMQRTMMYQTRVGLSPSGFGREFRLRFNDFFNHVDFGGSLKKKVDIGGSFGAGIRQVEVRSMQIYPDGTRSVGNEYYFNGVYRNQELYWTYGGFINIRPLRFITLQGRIFRNALGLGSWSGEETYLAALEDGNSFEKNRYSAYLPYDYALHVQNVSNAIIDETNVIPAQFPGWNLQLSVFLNLSFGDKD